MIFYKTSSFGNDFIEIDVGELSPKGAAAAAGVERGALVREICDRQRGVGADGVVFYRPRQRGASFEIFNRDGGEAELSGNGMAGLAAVLLQRRLAGSPLILRAAVGSRRVVLTRRQGSIFHLDVEIGVPDFGDQRFFPFLKKGENRYDCAGLKFHPVAVGNPHAVVILPRMPAAGRLAALGGKLEGHPMFLRRVNVEFVQSTGAGTCRVFFYERGVGPTQASSTGSAAVFAVLRRLGLAGDRLAVACGSESIGVNWEKGIIIQNRTRLVCRGEYFPCG